jgi:chromosome partitioning protein
MASGQSIAVMNTKGGVGKSTIVLALSETLSVFHNKKVLIVDADAQASISYLIAGPNRLTDLQDGGKTLVEFLYLRALQKKQLDWRQFTVGPVSDVDEARSIWLLPSDTTLTLFEREVSSSHSESTLLAILRNLLGEAKLHFDFIFVDCPPGLSVLTEAWLRACDYHLSPTKPDYISCCGLAFFRRFREMNNMSDLAENLGVLISMQDPSSVIDREFNAWLRRDEKNRCFQSHIPLSSAMKHASSFVEDSRSYSAKYPGDAGIPIKRLTNELLSRCATKPN